MQDNTDALGEITVPHMAHTDLWQGNILLNKDGDGRYRVAAIIDLDRAIFGDPFWDFSTPWIINEHFIKGYPEAPLKNEAHMRPDYVYRLICSFFECYVQLVEYDREDNFNREREKTRKLLRDYSSAF